MAVGHGAAPTGFSRVLDSVIQRLSQKYDFHHFATNHRSEHLDGRWSIYGNPDNRDPNGLERLSELIDQLQPQIVLVLNDLWFCCVHAYRLRSRSNRPVLMAYSPVDGELTRPDVYSLVGVFDKVVAYTQFGKNELDKIRYEDERLGFHCLTKSIEIIPHGVDTDTFFPLNAGELIDRSAAKRRLFGERESGGFIVLNAAKHDARKRLDLTIGGFARFAKNKPPNVKLYLHTGATFDGPDIRELAQRAGISDRLISTDGWLEDHPAVNDDDLNLIYNATDVGINTSSGEGWGLISFEHAATGAPQIVPAHSACKELWTTVNTILPIRNQGEHVGLGMLRKFVDADDIASILEKLYSNRQYRQEQAQKAYANATQPAYKWDRIATQWDHLLQRTTEILSSSVV